MIYFASKTKHAHKWLQLRAEGWPVACTWIDEAGFGQTSDWQDLWGRCIAEAAKADALILYRAARDETLKGALVEVGAALAHGVPVFAVGVGPEFSFTNHEKVRLVKSLECALSESAKLIARKVDR